MKKRSLAIVVLALFLPFAAACSSDSTGDLDKGDLSKELVKSGMQKKEADCVADALIKADFTKSEIDNLNSGKTGSVDSEKVAAYTKAATSCITG